MRRTIIKRLLAVALSTAMIVTGSVIPALAGDTVTDETVAEFGTLENAGVAEEDVESAPSGTIAKDEDGNDVVFISVLNAAETKSEEREVPLFDKDGEPILDDEEEQIVKKYTVFYVDFKPDSSGNYNYYLGSDYTGHLCINRDVNIDLNGKTLTAGADGPAIFVEGKAKVRIFDSSEKKTGKIIGGIATEYENGGGVVVEGELIMLGGTITSNRAATIDLEGGDTLDGTGGGVTVNGVFSMYDGAITQNYGDYGGGVFVDGSGTFNMYGGSITKNGTKAGEIVKQGGGIYNAGTVNLYGGTITENSASETGDGIYNEGILNLCKGTAINVTGNADDNVYLAEESSFTVPTMDEIPSKDSVIGVTLDPDRGEECFTSGWGTYVEIGTLPTTIFRSDASDSADAVLVDSGTDGELTFATAVAKIEKNGALTNFATVGYALGRANDDDTVTLVKDVKEDVPGSSEHRVTLDLAGHVYAGEDQAICTSSDTAVITIKDSSEGQTGYIRADGTAVVVEEGNVTLESGTIKGSARGVSVEDVASFTMKGGLITGNAGTEEGGGINAAGTVNLISGEISGNTGAQGGGINVSGTLNVGPGVVKVTGNKNSAGAVDNVFLVNDDSCIAIAGELKSGSAIGVGYDEGYEGYANRPFTAGWETGKGNTNRDIFTNDVMPGLRVHVVNTEGGAKELAFSDESLQKVALVAKRGTEAVKTYSVKVGDVLSVDVTPADVDMSKAVISWYRKSASSEDILLAENAASYTLSAKDNDERVYALVTYSPEGADDPEERTTRMTGRVGRDYSAYMKDEYPEEDEDENLLIYIIEMDDFTRPSAGMPLDTPDENGLIDSNEISVYSVDYVIPEGEEETPVSASDTAEKGKTYRLKVDVVPDQYYAFASLDRLTVLVNGEKINAKLAYGDPEEYNDDDTHIVMSLDFTVDTEANVINEVSFTGVENSVGAAFKKDIKLATKNAAISALHYYKASDETTAVDDGVVEANTDYKLKITLAANEGYYFADAVKVRINGDLISDIKTEKVFEAGEPRLIVTYSFNSSHKSRFLVRIYLQKLDGSYPDKADVETVAAQEYTEAFANSYKPEKHKGFTLSFRQMLRESQDIIYEYDGERNNYTIKLDPNGGTMEVKDYSLKLKYGETFPALPPATKDGATPYGWNTKADGSGTDYKAGSVADFDAENNAQITLYANWTGGSSPSSVSGNDVEKVVKQSYDDVLAAIAGSKERVDTLGAKDDTASVTQIYSKGKMKMVTITNIPAEGARVTLNPGIKLQIPEGYAVNGKPVSPDAGAKLPAVQARKNIITLKPEKKVGEYRFTLANATTKTAIEVRVVNTLFDKSIKNAVLDASAKVSSGKSLSKGGEELTVRTTRVKDDIKKATGFVSGQWMVGKTKVPNVKPGEEIEFTVKKAKVVVKADFDGNLIISPLEGSDAGKIPVGYMLNGKTYKTTVSVVTAVQSKKEAVRTNYASAGLLKK